MASLKTLSAFCRRMGTGLRAGVDILRMLANEEKAGDNRHQAAMRIVRQGVSQGESLASAMQLARNYFPRLLIQMVNASEKGGRLESFFLYMADYYEQLKGARSDFISRITWPVVQLVMAIVIIGLVILVQGILSPTSTYDASGFGLRGIGGFVTYITTVLLIFGSLGLIGFALWKNWFNNHQWTIPIVQRIPLLGTAFITLGLSRLSMTLSMLLNAGVDAKESVSEAFEATGNHYFLSGKPRSLAVIDQGGSFGDAFEASRVLPNEFIEAVRIGELSGTETESLDHLALDYQRRAKEALAAIAGITSYGIWLGILIFLAVVVIRMFMSYVNMLNEFLP